ncbi:MAG: hypothetical protein ACRC1H_13060, partial [Caldilineaceae bacterium]
MSNPESFPSRASGDAVGRKPASTEEGDAPRRTALTRDEGGAFVTNAPAERAIIVGVELRDRPGLLSMEDSLTELELLADTAGLDVVGTLTQKLDRPHPATYIGSGKVEEMAMLATEMGATVVLFDEELSPRQQRDLEEALGEETKVIDRTALILDIFANHARTREGAVQVELAQYEYRL